MAEERAQHRPVLCLVLTRSDPSSTASCVAILLVCKWEYRVYGVGWLPGLREIICLLCSKEIAALTINEFTFWLQEFDFFFTEAQCFR